ncbi:MAG: serine/threonine-protein kinase, partial [Acidobacteriota bacterium]
MDSRKFGRYEIHSTLGRGAMGVVYKAFDPILERSLAIKVMSSGTDEEAVRRFFREARATAGLRHPNIVSVYDIGEENRQPYIAIEYLDGQDLAQFLKQDLFVPFAWKLRLIIDVCRGLHHAHENGIIHRDIKPSNIRITREGEVKIVDFGVAKLKSSELTATGMVVGTPSYMSPQQVKGVKELDGRSDLFSAGVLLFELITGRKPFAAPELHSVMFQICNAPHPPLTEVLPGCSEELSAILDRALAKDTEGRFQTGEEMAAALEQFLKQLDGACKSLQQAFDRKAEQLLEQCSLLKEEGLADLVPSDLQQIPP